MIAKFILFNRFTFCINQIRFALHEMKYVSYYAKWNTFRIMWNEKSFVLGRSNWCENANANRVISISIFTKVKIAPIDSQIKILITHL